MFESRGVGGFGLRVILLMRARIPKRTMFTPIWTESPPLAFHSFSTFLLPFVSLPDTQATSRSDSDPFLYSVIFRLSATRNLVGSRNLSLRDRRIF